MASGPILHGKKLGKIRSNDRFSWGSKITAEGNCSHEIKRHLLLGRKARKNLDILFKSRDVTLPTRAVVVQLLSPV